MRKTIALIASLDTKEAEVSFMKEMIERLGYSTLIIDVGARGSSNTIPDIKSEEVAGAAGRDWLCSYSIPKSEMISGLAEGIAVLMPKLYEQGKFDAVLSIGGAQNTMIGVSAMKALPIGLPKLMVSTVASGQRIFEPLVGTRDIVIMPSVADLCGINKITKRILSNAVAAICGMAEHAGIPISPDGEFVIGATLMGVTNDGVAQAVRILEEAGCQVVSFHSTGVGGRAMEEFILQGTIRAVIDLSLHEITAEMFGGGFSVGAGNRLVAACEAGIPQVIAPGGIDFIDYSVNELPEDINTRKYMFHNSEIAHIKLFRDEIVQVGEIIAERLNKSRGPVTMIIPLRGFRQSTLPGEVLYDPEVDAALIEVLHKGLKPHIKVIDVDANINDLRFSQAAAEEMLKLVRL